MAHQTQEKTNGSSVKPTAAALAASVVPQSEKLPEGMSQLNKDQLNATFDLPALLVNSFQICTTESYVRLVAAEKDGSNKPRIRAVLACDLKSFLSLQTMVNTTVSRMMAAAAAHQAEVIKNQETTNAQAANDTQAKVG